MDDSVFFRTLVTKSLETKSDSDERFFEGLLTVEMKDKQGEITIVDELYKVLPTWMDRGAPITDTHSNRVVGKGINFAKTEAQDAEGNAFIKNCRKYLNKDSYKIRVKGQHLKPELYGKGRAYHGANMEDSTHMRVYIDAKRGE